MAGEEKVRIRLLGGLETEGPNGGSAVFPTRKSAWLLASLAMNAGRPQSRAALCALLWSDRAEEQARGSLRQGLSVIRKCFDGMDPPPVESDRSSISLRAESIDLDVKQFEELCKSGDSENLARAADLYRGPFLDGEDPRDPGFEEWMLAERARLKEMAAGMFLKLGEAQLAAGQATEAMAPARRLVEADPLHEAGHRLLMRALVADGQRAAALNQYKALTERLAEELDVEPAPETTRLYEEIQNGEMAVAPPPAPAATDTASTSPAPPPRDFADTAAVAVLPFENQGGGQDDDYLVEGITEDLIASLSCWRWFPVIGHNTTSAFRNSGRAPGEIGRDLGARYLVTGTVRRAGDRSRITAQLTDAETGRQLWSHKQDFVMSDIFAVQDEICEKIVGAIEPELVLAEERRAALKRPADLTVWDLILRATAARSRSGAGYGTPDDNRECADYLRRALELDPQSSQAMALLAQTLWHDALNGWAEDRDRNLEEVLELTRRAVAIDDGNWLAYTIMGLAHTFALRMPDRGVEVLERAVSLNPSAGLALHGLGCAMGFSGRPAEAIPNLNAVSRVDPRYRGSMAALADLGYCNLMLGNIDEALVYFRQSLAQQPDYLRGRQRLVAGLEIAGQHEAARTEMQSLLQDQPGLNSEYVRATYPFSKDTDLDIFLNALKAAGLPD